MKKILTPLFLFLLFCSAKAFAFSGHTATIVVDQQVTCFNGSNGAATAYVTGGIGPYSFLWSNGIADTSIVNVSAGNYYCIVTDSSDMSVDTAFCTITQPANPNMVVNGNNMICPGGWTALSVTGTGITAYNWMPATGLSCSTCSTPMAFPTATTTYTVVGTAGACTYTTSITIVVSQMLTISMIPTGTSCNGSCDGSIAAAAFGGSAPYTFTWSPGNMTTQTINGLCAGAYTVTVSDATGCVATNTAIVTQPSPVSTATNSSPSSSCSACDGQAMITATGGTGSFTYAWSGPNGFTSNQMSPSGLCAGIYNVTVADMNGCLATNTVTVGNSSLAVSISAHNDSCGLNSGWAVASVNGNTGNATYSWQPGGQTTQGIYDLGAGTYTVTVNDTTACQSSAIVTITNTNAPALVTTSSGANCGTPNGFIAASASGGTSPYMYSLNGAAPVLNPSWPNLLPGTYTVTVTDANGCSATTTQMVWNFGLNASASITMASCNNNTSGSATINVSNGTLPYTYLWSNGDTTATISNVSAGGYTCAVSDAGGCSATVYAFIPQNANIYVYFTYSYANCGVNSLTAIPYGGTAPYTYQWSNGFTGQVNSNLPPGIYTVTVTDANGCQAIGTYNVYTYNYSTITGNIYADVNSNCVSDGGDYALNSWMITATNSSGNSFYAYSYGGGNYTLYVPSGAVTYTLTATPAYFGGQNYYQLTCALANVVSTTGNCDTVVFDVPMDATPAQDLRVHLYCGNARPGFTRWYSIYYSNPGTTVMNGTVEFDLDPALTFTGSTPAASSVTGNHVEWNFTGLQPNESRYISISAQVPLSMALGVAVHDSAYIEPLAGDLFAADNNYACSGITTASYDPNMKEVWSADMLPSGEIDTSGAALYYTVHFQNTGTDTAFNIVVRDTLSSLLDVSTIEMLGASANYTWSLQPGRCLEVRFNAILLPDSNINEPASHGFFNYKIHTAQNISQGQLIDNNAGIYFDFNAPVITNTVTVPVVVFTTLQERNNALEATVFPNPTNLQRVRVKVNGSSYRQLQFTLFDATGKNVISKQYSNTQFFDVDLTGLSEGLYFYNLVNEKGERTSGKIIVK